MSKPKLGTSKHGKLKHYAVGAIIKKDDKYLLIDRATIPYGWAAPAGHVEEGKTFEEALYQKILAETGREIINKKLLVEEEIPWNTCSHNIDCHHWKLYEVTLEEGKIIIDFEGAKSFGWYSSEEIKKLKLERVWKYWFEGLWSKNNT